MISAPEPDIIANDVAAPHPHHRRHRHRRGLCSIRPAHSGEDVVHETRRRGAASVPALAIFAPRPPLQQRRRCLARWAGRACLEHEPRDPDAVDVTDRDEHVLPGGHEGGDAETEQNLSGPWEGRVRMGWGGEGRM